MISGEIEKSLVRVLRKFKQDEFSKILDDWSVFEDIIVEDELTPENGKKFNKTQLIRRVLEIAREKHITRKKIGELDLIYTLQHPESKKWFVYQLTKSPAGEEKVVQDPNDLASKLGHLLSMHLKHDLNKKLTNNGIWFSIGFHKKVSNTLVIKTVFLIIHPHSSYFFITAVARKELDVILQILLEIFGGSSIQEVPLSGKDYSSLVEMTLRRHCQGSFSKYRQNEVDLNPLLRLTGSRKRKAVSCLEEMENFAISYENKKENEKHESQIDKVFGGSSLPKIQKLEFQMKTKIRGTTFLAANILSKTPFHCSVQFEGPSVLEGIKELCQIGLVSLPLPHHMAQLPSMAKNKFLLTDRDKSREIPQQ